MNKFFLRIFIVFYSTFSIIQHFFYFYLSITLYLNSCLINPILGDLSYADCVGRLWDVYGEMIESVSSQKPWMVGPGNHEIEQIFVSDIDPDGEWKKIN